MTNQRAALAFIVPAGISLIAVREFFLSIFLSMYRLNAMAALRAKTIQSSTFSNKCHSNEAGVKCTAKKKPISAKGIAKMVWENFTNDR